jgi:hypothetical protein
MEDVIVFQLDQGFDFLSCRPICLVGRIELVKYPQCGPLAEDHRPLDGTFQLPYIAGPMVFLKGVIRLLPAPVLFNSLFCLYFWG